MPLMSSWTIYSTGQGEVNHNFKVTVTSLAGQTLTQGESGERVWPVRLYCDYKTA